VIAVPDEESGVRIIAFMNWTEDGGPSAVQLKQFCAKMLPKYMIPDKFSVQPCLPRTSTDKIDLQRLKDLEA
jgi:acyl-CoA synthetase (AMP-forming)/AMP-acid ligase II